MKGLRDEILKRSGPYLVVILSNGLIACSFWLFLFIFKIATQLLHLNEFIDEIVGHMLAVGSVLAFVFFIVLVYVDVRKLRKEEHQDKT